MAGLLYLPEKNGMIGILPGIPPNVAGFRASGEVTREDYEKVVFPEIRRHVEKFGQLNFVFYVDTSLKNFSAGAWLRDIWLGIKELARWHKVAIVSDVERIRHFTDTISFLLPGEYKGFPTHLLDDAIRWASTTEQETSPVILPDYIEALLPAQVRGESTQTATEVVVTKEEDARYIFERASERLLDVNQWTDYCGSLSAGFQLADDTGKDLQGHAAVNDLIRIDIPGPGPRHGRGYDWVKVEKVEQPVTTATDSLFLLQVRPCAAPLSPTDKIPAHFLEDSATSTFVIERKGNKVTATVFGRNEVPNTAQPEQPDKLRNAVIGTLGAIGLSKVQWKALVQGLLEKE
jgi:SpoIIAA-like